AELHTVDYRLLVAVMVAESRCADQSRSPAGAVGAMQLMPETARWLGVKDLGSVRENVTGAAKYLSMLLERFNGDLQPARAAYNAGPTKVRRVGGIPPYSETKTFVNRVITYYKQLQAAEPDQPPKSA